MCRRGPRPYPLSAAPRRTGADQSRATHGGRRIKEARISAGHSFASRRTQESSTFWDTRWANVSSAGQARYRLPATSKKSIQRAVEEGPRADRAIMHMARDHNAGGQSEPDVARVGELLFGRRLQQGVSGARCLRGDAVAPVVALQAQSQATKGRELSTLAPLRALRARTSDPAWARRAVDEGVRSCPRARIKACFGTLDHAVGFAPPLVKKFAPARNQAARFEGFAFFTAANSERAHRRKCQTSTATPAKPGDLL